MLSELQITNMYHVKILVRTRDKEFFPFLFKKELPHPTRPLANFFRFFITIAHLSLIPEVILFLLIYQILAKKRATAVLNNLKTSFLVKLHKLYE